MVRGRLLLLSVAFSSLASVTDACAATPARKSPSPKPTAKARQPLPSTKATARKPAPPRPIVLQSISVEPSLLTLSGPRSERQILVSGAFSDGLVRDLTGLAEFKSASPSVVRLRPSGVALPAGDGSGSIKVTLGKFTAWAKVTVKDSAVEAPASFHNEVVPVLTKAGCNQGACHGAQHGKGGLKLSLLGYDPDADYLSIVRQNEGRRVVMSDPEQSLMLLKPVLGTPHAGGMRFKKGSYEYQVLLNWLRDGAPAPDPKEATIASVDVVPARVTMQLPRTEGPQTVTLAIPQAKGPARLVKFDPVQRLVALAKYSDGRVEDVGRRAQFNSLNDAQASADTEGLVAMQLRGETSVMVRYRGQATIARFTVPYHALKAYPEVAKANYIDELTVAKWREMGLTPSPKSTDAEFMRRVYLDLLGVLPKPEEIKPFLASADPKKREKLVDEVLARPEYIDYWTLKWGDLLRNHRDKLGDKGMWSFYNWLRSAFRENRPIDQFARELITAQGSTYTTGPANYYRVARTPADLAETTSQVFLGVRLACARCHHHPFEKWSQDDYWQFAAFFSRVGLKGSQEFGLFGQEQVVRLNATGEVSNPRTGKVMKPTPLDAPSVDDPTDRRRGLATWMTAPENLMFARNIVNRYWGYLMGRGIVEPVDDMRVTNPPSNPDLLDALAKDFVAHKFDAKYLIKTIVLSETYQLTSNPTPENKQDEIFYTKYAVKRMAAEELLDAVNFATGTSDKFPNLPAGLRAVQLPDPAVQNYFLDVFGRPERQITCECERSAEANMAQALHLMNSDYVQNKIADGKGRLAKLIADKKTDPEIVEELYLVTVSRPPAPDELAKGQEIITQAPSKKEGIEDLLWALLNSREFIFKH